MSDMAPRAIEILSSASLILAEDTRTSAPLLQRFGISTPMLSHHKYNEHSETGKILDRIEAGETIALISDAGTPGISDPGFMLSREARRREVDVETLPGPTAFVPALVSSGLPCDRFIFEGFLPQKKGRATRLAELAAQPLTFIIYESPLRVARTLAQLAEICGESRPASVAREISKLHETHHRDTLGALRDYFSVNQARGEIVIIVSGQEKAPAKEHKNKYRQYNPEPE
ncbi:MAG: 16S rRNA (cytidine(1402)-2'-O)-methyltransferase [Muribaculaceae bacterium]|nr:16S rRNA (cytidine(1402)-2'-O)-methyltransferase [Muribaculaceae bacterium]